VEPVPPFRWPKGGESFAGWYFCATTGEHIGYESWLERDRLILLDSDPQVTERACRAVGWKFMRAGVPDPLLMANMRWLSRYRRRRCLRRDVAYRLLEVFRKPGPLRAGVVEVGDPLMVLPVLSICSGPVFWRQMWSLGCWGRTPWCTRRQGGCDGAADSAGRSGGRGTGAVRRAGPAGPGSYGPFSDAVGHGRQVPPALLFADGDFEVVDSSGRMPLPPVSLLETLPQAVLEKALWSEGHILEVLHGLPPDAEAGAEPKPQYTHQLDRTREPHPPSMLTF
jgi:hypothetical protein